MSNTTKSKILSTKKKDYGFYKDKKPVKKDIKQTGKIYLPIITDNEEDIKKENEACEEMLKKEEIIDEMKEKMKERADSMVDTLAEGKSVSFADVEEVSKTLEEKRSTQIYFNDIIGQMNRKKLLLDMMEQKAEMEENINRKLEWDDIKKKNHMLNNYLEMKKSMIMVESFMKSIIKEEIVNMRHREKNSKATEKNLEEITEKMFEEHEKLEILNSNPGKCKCSDCRIRHLMYGSSKHKLSSMKMCLLSDNIKLEVLADDDRFSVFSSQKKNDSRHITALEKKNNRTVIDIKLTELKEELWEIDEFDFSIGIMVNLCNFGLEKNIMVSYSSFVLVSWIRLMDMDLSKTTLVTEMDKMSSNGDTIEETPNGSCFYRMLKSFMGAILPDINETMYFYSMAELPEWVEMKFITMAKKHHVYIRYTSKEDMNNHISTRRFKGSIKIKAYLLSAPMFRNIKWFMDDISPDFETWQEKQKENKEKTVMSMLMNIYMEKKVDDTDTHMDILWPILINFNNYEDMIEIIYGVEMRTLESFRVTQINKSKMIKDNIKRLFSLDLESLHYIPKEKSRVSLYLEIYNMIVYEHKKFRGLQFKSEQFKEFLKSSYQLEMFVWNSFLVFEDLDSLDQCVDRFSLVSTVSSLLVHLDKFHSVMERTVSSCFLMIDEENYEDMNLWKRKMPAPLSSLIPVFNIMDELSHEQMEPSFDELYMEEEDDLGEEAYHNLDT